MLISYAQNHEDVILFRVFKNKKRGFYVDIGACFPDEGSVTKIFYDLGWHGINVEPHPQAFSQLKKKRRRDKNLNLAISSIDGTLTLYEGLSIGETSSINNTNASFEVQSLSLSTLFKRYVAVPIDFLKVDVEGHEYEVLLGGEWDIFRPKIIICEVTLPWTNKTRSEIPKINNLLFNNDYELAYFDGINNYYVAKECSELKIDLAIQPNVVDNYISYRELNVINSFEALKLEIQRKIQLSDAENQNTYKEDMAKNFVPENKSFMSQLSRISLFARFKEMIFSVLKKELNQTISIMKKVLQTCIKSIANRLPYRICALLKRNTFICRIYTRFMPLQTNLAKLTNQALDQPQNINTSSLVLCSELLYEKTKWNLGKRIDE